MSIILDRTYLIRYYTMAVGSVAINFGSFWIFYHVLGVWYIAAAVIAFTLRFLFKFISIRTWLFEKMHAPNTLAKHGVYFFLMEGGSLVLSTLALASLVEYMAFPPFLALACVVLLFSFIGMVLTHTLFEPAQGAID